MEKIHVTIHSPYRILVAACKSAEEYGEKALNADKVRKAWKYGKDICIHKVNTPEGVPCTIVYFRVKSDKQGFHWVSYVRLFVNEERTTFVHMAGDGKTIMLLYAHAIEQYIERHGWDGTLEECRNHINMGLMLTCGEYDKITGECEAYFDGGLFLGEKKGDIFRYKTFIMNRQCKPNQRMHSLNAENELRKISDEQLYNGNDERKAAIEHFVKKHNNL